MGSLPRLSPAEDMLRPQSPDLMAVTDAMFDKIHAEMAAAPDSEDVHESDVPKEEAPILARLRLIEDNRREVDELVEDGMRAISSPERLACIKSEAERGKREKNSIPATFTVVQSETLNI